MWKKVHRIRVFCFQNLTETKEFFDVQSRSAGNPREEACVNWILLSTESDSSSRTQTFSPFQVDSIWVRIQWSHFSASFTSITFSSFYLKLWFIFCSSMNWKLCNKLGTFYQIFGWKWKRGNPDSISYNNLTHSFLCKHIRIKSSLNIVIWSSPEFKFLKHFRLNNEVSRRIQTKKFTNFAGFSQNKTQSLAISIWLWFACKMFANLIQSTSRSMRLCGKLCGCGHATVLTVLRVEIAMFCCLSM